MSFCPCYRQVRLHRSPLASEDALGALRASSRPTNTGLEVHVKEGYVSTSVRTSEDALHAPMSVMALFAALVAFTAATAVTHGPHQALHVR